MSGERLRWGQAHGVAHRRRVYRTADALEVDEVGGFEIARRRVFFTEIRLVTLHRARQGAAVWVLAGLAGIALLAGLLAGASGIPAYILYGLAGLSALGAMVSAAPVWVVTAHGRRTRAELRFRLRQARAEQVYRELCHLANEAQFVLAARLAEEGPRRPDPLAEIAGIPAPPPPAAIEPA
ncbi:MAG TPA: hypothetical protein VGR07_08290 [Thermoanaerobaculia bacterium]|nr:hypothetical protein [Thermoanaerobaculia bacterium]